ncbi:signal peptidase I [Deinococcus maricopensis]|uniref:Signal peptidase I n=1 Tax=Deinococcus maricopensis (strain DSM 21211 / LMG 22137 / NRRL B-23946 / LB-34) TaxID=709986 RepID=E8UBG2_DEIML|nr:signal peptidase I [Deinococcus maricopensis]ADV68401.1 signal peptidase I [Deinococcus maricopensis DSM 21211]
MTQVQKPPQSFLKRLWKELLEPIVFAVVITQFVATLVGVDGTSMMPNLRNGERVLVPKYETWLHKVGVGNFKRGDILIFKPPRAAEDEVRSFVGLWQYRPFLIKRLVALPGDRVRMDGGNLYVNNTRIDQSFTTDYWQAQGCWDTQSDIANNAQSGNRYAYMKTQKEFTVPAGQYFMMGDNRTEQGSLDSRTFGPIPLRDIAGRAAMVVWPIMRKTNAKYNCDNPSPSAIEFSGNSVLNWRLLQRPAGFGALNK